MAKKSSSIMPSVVVQLAKQLSNHPKVKFLNQITIVSSGNPNIMTVGKTMLLISKRAMVEQPVKDPNLGGLYTIATGTW
jgi:hypothetical protein